MKTFDITKRARTTQEMNEALEKAGYSVEQSYSGYYRLMRGNESIIDDSSCEDFCDYDNAISCFYNSKINNSQEWWLTEKQV